MIFYTQSPHTRLKRVLTVGIIIMMSAPLSLFSNGDNQNQEPTKPATEQQKPESTPNNQEQDKEKDTPEDSSESNPFARMSPEDFALLLQLLQASQGQKDASSKVVEFKDSKDPSYHQLLTVCILAHTAWRIYFQYHKFDKTTYSSGKVKPHLGETEKLIQKHIFPPTSAFLGLWHTIDSLVKEKHLDFDPLASKSNFQKGIVTLLTKPELVRYIQGRTARAHSYERYFEEEWPLALQAVLLALPGIVYHYWKGRSEHGGYVTSSKEGSIGGTELAGSSIHSYVTSRILRPSPDCHCDEKQAYESKVEYEQAHKKWWIPWHYITNRQAKLDEYNNLMSTDNYRIATVTPGEAHRSSDWRDAPLLKYAYSGSFELLLSYLYEKAQIEGRLVSKVGPEKLGSFYEKTYGAAHPNVMFSLITSIGSILLYEASKRNKEGMFSIFPHFEKTDFNMCDFKKIEFIKKKKWYVKTKEIDAYKEIGYGHYIAKRLIDKILVNMGSYLGPKVWNYCTENRNKLLQYATAPLRSLSSFMVTLGICKESPWNKTGNAAHERMMHYLSKNPALLQVFLIYGAQQALEQEAYKSTKEHVPGKDPREELAEAITMVDHILELEEKKSLLRHRHLKLPTDTEMLTLQAHIDTRIQDVMAVIKKHALIPKTADLAQLMCLNFAGVWSAHLGATLFPNIAKEAFETGKDLCKSAYNAVAA